MIFQYLYQFNVYLKITNIINALIKFQSRQAYVYAPKRALDEMRIKNSLKMFKLVSN